MVMPQTGRRWTREDVLALPDDGKRYELMDGELLVSLSPTGVHQSAVLELFRRLDPFVRAHRIGSIGLAPADLRRDGGQVVQPDLFVSLLLPGGRKPLGWEEHGIPLLIAEVTSPSTARFDRITKRHRFQRTGVAEYWIVDTDSRSVERWTPGDIRPEALDGALSWQPPGAAEPLMIDLADYFRDVWGD